MHVDNFWRNALEKYIYARLIFDIMRQTLILCWGILMSTCLSAQKQNVAVYIPATNEISVETQKIIGNELVSAIVSTNKYNAVERTSEFLYQLSKEQNYQRSGNVDYAEISRLGRQYGADIVCVVETTPYESLFYIAARLIDVEKATILNTARTTSSLNNLDEIIKACEYITTKLVGDGTSLTYAQKYSACSTPIVRNYNLIEIDNSGTRTKVLLKYISVGKTCLFLKKEDCFIQDNNTGLKYRLTDVSGITLAPESTKIENTIYPITLWFEKMPSTTKVNLSISSVCKFNNLALIPYGKKDYFVFEDQSTAEYQKIKMQCDQLLAQEQQRTEQVKIEQQAEAERVQEKKAQQYEKQMAQMNEALDKLGNAINDLNSYYIVFDNRHSSPRNLYIDGQFFGKVGGNSIKKFQLPITKFGILTSIQASGYIITPSKERFNIPRPQQQQTFRIHN